MGYSQFSEGFKPPQTWFWLKLFNQEAFGLESIFLLVR